MWSLGMFHLILQHFRKLKMSHANLVRFVVLTFLEKLEESATLIPHSTMVAHFSWLQSLLLSNEFSFTYRHNLFDPVDNEC